MRKSCALVLLATFSWIGGLGQDARAGVTIDVVFQDATPPSGITIHPGDPGPGCTFGGYWGGSVSTGYCMDVMLYTTDTLVSVGASVAYDSDNGLSVASFYEWKGVGVSFNMQGTVLKECAPPAGVTDNGVEIGSFDCVVPPPNLTTPMAPGTYRIGTIVWDTSATTTGTEVIWIVSASAGAVCDGNPCGPEITLWPHGSHILTIIPEVVPVPSMGATGAAVLGVAVFGISVMGLLIAARRRSN